MENTLAVQKKPIITDFTNWELSSKTSFFLNGAFKIQTLYVNFAQGLFVLLTNDLVIDENTKRSDINAKHYSPVIRAITNSVGNGLCDNIEGSTFGCIDISDFDLWINCKTQSQRDAAIRARHNNPQHEITQKEGTF
jgi:hypothetical protein